MLTIIVALAVLIIHEATHALGFDVLMAEALQELLQVSLHFDWVNLEQWRDHEASLVVLRTNVDP